MPKPHRNIVIFIAAVFAFVPCFSNADVLINEIMYDPKDADFSGGGEWIEVYNTGPSPINLTEWYFYESDTNHGIVSDINNQVPVGGYAVISSDLGYFKSYFPNYAGLIFKASFSLNDGETLALKSAKDGMALGPITYTSEWGAKNDGDSLQFSGGKWIAAAPTPGAQNAISVAPDTTTGQNGTANSSGSGYPLEPQIFALIDGPATIVAGVAYTYKAKTIGLDKKPIDNARYIWSFGDGSSGQGQAVSHSWKEPGAYALIVESSSTLWSADARLKVQAIPSSLKIVDVKSGAGGYVKIANENASDIDISGWAIATSGGVFYLPRQTIILGRTVLPISGETINLDLAGEVLLLYPSGTVAYRYEAPETPSARLATDKPQITDKTEPVRQTAVSSAEPKSKKPVPTGKTLQSGASSTILYTAAADNSGGLSEWYLALIGFVGLAIVGFFTMRYGKSGEKKTDSSGSSLRAEDFKIIEIKDEDLPR